MCKDFFRNSLFAILYVYGFGLPLSAFEIIPSPLNREEIPKGTVALATVFQNEGRFLIEWIEYHKMIGVRHFYLYNNLSDDAPEELLHPYIERGEISLFNVPHRTKNADQHNALQDTVYGHAVESAKGRHPWLAILDSDEFICLKKETSLPRFLQQFQKNGALAIYWQNFGSSHIEKLEEGELQIESFIYRAADSFGPHRLFKSIVRPEAVAEVGIHYSRLKMGYIYTSANHEAFSHHPRWENPPVEDVAIYHYWWRDEHYFRETKVPRRRIWGSGYSPHQIEMMRLEHNAVLDLGMARFVKPLKKRLEGVLPPQKIWGS